MAHHFVFDSPTLQYPSLEFFQNLQILGALYDGAHVRKAIYGIFNETSLHTATFQPVDRVTYEITISVHGLRHRSDEESALPEIGSSVKFAISDDKASIASFYKHEWDGTVISSNASHGVCRRLSHT